MEEYFDPKPYKLEANFEDTLSTSMQAKLDNLSEVLSKSEPKVYKYYWSDQVVNDFIKYNKTIGVTVLDARESLDREKDRKLENKRYIPFYEHDLDWWMAELNKDYGIRLG
ncbi:MAG: hypothetical protein Q7T74_05490 [Candidatus Saccharibacteria bacterium]|nr:hypothetical protein [Candidatus Saccharibacteria bacterium]